MQFHASTHPGNVVVIATGGTIAATSDECGARVPTRTGAELVEASGTTVPTRVIDTTSLDSSSMTLPDIDRLIAVAREALADPTTRGVVLTHGTDSMAETALALDLSLIDDHPVILTGAQNSADHPAPDGPGNLRHAIELAASEQTEPGVLVHFGGKTHPARGLMKRHTEELDAFALRSPAPLPRPRPVGPVTLSGINVVVVNAWPGADGSLVRVVVDTRPDGIVVAGLGSGNVSDAMGAELVRALELGIPVVVATQVPYGAVSLAYGGAGGGSTLGRAGAVSAGWLSPGQARIALTVALAAGVDPATLLGS